MLTKPYFRTEKSDNFLFNMYITMPHHPLLQCEKYRDEHNALIKIGIYASSKPLTTYSDVFSSIDWSAVLVVGAPFKAVIISYDAHTTRQYYYYWHGNHHCWLVFCVILARNAEKVA